MKTLLLESDACIEVIRGNPAPVEAYPDASFVISVISRFEIRSCLKKKKSRKLEERARAFLRTVETVPFDEDAADRAAEIRVALEKKGKPIGAYDTLLAGHALALDLPILTGNVNEFNRVPKLEVRGWRNED